jgi:SAM-dependent methyltransferase
MPRIQDPNLVNEEQFWNEVAKQGWPETIERLNPYMDSKMFEDYQRVCQQFIMKKWPDYDQKKVSIGEIGCGNGSAISYLEKMEFLDVNYLGVDISIDMMRLARRRPMPVGWNIHFARTSGDVCVFKEGSFDIIFSISVLHYFDPDKIFDCVSKSLKNDGLFIVNEPSERNPFAKIGRRFGIGHGALLPTRIRDFALNNGLDLVYEKGLHFFTWPLYYVLLSAKPPKPLAALAYYVGNAVDSLVKSPSLNYCFIQIYKK